MKIVLLAWIVALAAPVTAQVHTSTTTTNHESSIESMPTIAVHHARRHPHIRHRAAGSIHSTSATVKVPAHGTATSTTTAITKQ